jgi:hypothetical protein
MDPTTIAQALVISSALASCPAAQPEQTVEAVRAPTVPVRAWPEPRELPEKTEPPHGEGSGESPIYGGLAVYGTPSVNVSNVSAHVMVDSGASGTAPYTSVAWLPNRFSLVVSTQEFEPDFVAPSAWLNYPFEATSSATERPYNSSMIHIRRAYTRRRG